MQLSNHKFVSIFVVCFLGFAFVMFVCLSKVRLNEVGVKVNQLGGGGIVQEDYEPGIYFLWPGAQTMLQMDPTVQQLQMGGGTADIPALELVGKDQYTTKFDITVLYRIKPGEAHSLAKVVGRTDSEIRKFVRSKSDKALWQVLGSLNTQDFYNVPLREEARANAKDVLEEELGKSHLELVDILIRAIEYDRGLEQKLVKKQLLDQNKALNVEKTRLEKELEKTESIERETQAEVAVIQETMRQEIQNIEAETDARVKEIEADARLTAEKNLAEAERYRREKTSQGELAKTQAKAKGEKAINEAYLMGGGQAYITRQMVDAIEFGEIEVNTNQVNPFDVAQLLKMLGLQAEEDGKQP